MQTFKPKPAELEKLERMKAFLKKLIIMCNRIEKSESPEDEIRRMRDILIQKEDTWVKEEGKNDIRYVLFSLFYNHDRQTMENLRSQRMDKEFSKNILKSLPAVRTKLQGFLKMASRDLRVTTRDHRSFNRRLKTSPP
ncbi:MAG: hypothetical protein AAB573_05145 [Patescibacteria group bacterium]